MKKGRLIVIEGADGAGKKTQAARLVARLEGEGTRVETLDFPRYTNNHFGRLLRSCLDGKCGDFMALHPKVAASLYAADRFESKDQITAWLKEGKTVVLDRYVSSNMLHQGAKIDDESELEEFLNWLFEIEHGVFGAPEPDIIIYLDVPASERTKLSAQAVLEGKHGVGLDVAESNIAHQEAAEEQAKRLIAERKNWIKIDCIENGQLLSIDDIHQDVYTKVKEI